MRILLELFFSSNQNKKKTVTVNILFPILPDVNAKRTISNEFKWNENWKFYFA